MCGKLQTARHELSIIVLGCLEVLHVNRPISECLDKFEYSNILLQVVKHLTQCVMDDVEDAFDKPCSVHKEALLKLLGHTTAKVTTNSVIWACYGRLILHTKDSSPENTERVS